MPALFEITILAIGITGLWVGADSAVSGASALAKRAGVHPVVAGLTVIAIGTSLPELIVCLIAALKGSADIAAGNITGSNVANVCLILGLSAVVLPLRTPQGLRAEGAAAALFMAALIPLCADGNLSRPEGAAVTALLLPLIIALYLRQANKNGPNTDGPVTDIPAVSGGIGIVLVSTLAGLAALALGSDLIVEGATGIARGAGVPELVIGASAVAVGTSLPELAASMAAVAKRENSIAIGNIAGSNLFNIVILGITATAAPLSVDADAPGFQMPFAAAMSLVALPFMKKGATIGRGAGAALLILYGLFLYRVFQW